MAAISPTLLNDLKLAPNFVDQGNFKAKTTGGLGEKAVEKQWKSGKSEGGTGKAAIKLMKRLGFSRQP